MLKSLRFSAALIAVIVTQISPPFLTSPANAADIATLNVQLKQSACTQNWGEAVKVIDKMIAITPLSKQTQHNELKTYRVRMQNLSVSNSNVDSWLKGYCIAPISSRNIANDNTIAKASVSNGTTIDQRFIEAYKRLIIRTNGNPDITSYLLDEAQSDPNSLIDSAKLYCKALRSGSSFDEMQELQAKNLVDASPRVKEIMITSVVVESILAPEYYCSEFTKR